MDKYNGIRDASGEGVDRCHCSNPINAIPQTIRMKRCVWRRDASNAGTEFSKLFVFGLALFRLPASLISDAILFGLALPMGMLAAFGHQTVRQTIGAL